MKDLMFKFFHESTKIKKIGTPTSSVDWPPEWKIVEFKSYPRLQQITLPKPEDANISLSQSIINRQSERNFSKKPVNLQQLSNLLFYSAGITKKESLGYDNGRRAYPSGGARYPLEIYLAVFEGKDIKEGIYHYNVKNHGLEELLKGNYRQEFLGAVGQDMVKESSFLLLISAVFNRTIAKYKDRGYRLILLEAGHLGQNISLVSTALNLKSCALGGFLDDKCSEILDIEKDNESVIYIFACG